MKKLSYEQVISGKRFDSYSKCKSQDKNVVFY